MKRFKCVIGTKRAGVTGVARVAVLAQAGGGCGGGGGGRRRRWWVAPKRHSHLII